MNKTLKFVFVFAIALAMFSSCKKSPSDLSILTSHKWVLTASTASYSDSSVTHNLIQPDTICQTSSYTEFHDRTPNNTLRLAYTYSTSNCTGYHTPEISIDSWDIDADNANIYLGGNANSGTGGTWYTLTSLNSSTMVTTYVQQVYTGTNSGAPHYTPVYHVVTTTTTYSVK